MRPNTLIKKVEWDRMGQRLLAQVRMAHPDQTINSRELDLTLEVKLSEPQVRSLHEALSWHYSGNQEFVQKMSFSRTSERDTTERSLGIKLLFGNVPVMVRQMSWYPLAYPKPEMRRGPREGQPDSAPVESLAHFLECTVGNPPPPKPPDFGPELYWMRNYIEGRSEYVGLTVKDLKEAGKPVSESAGPNESHRAMRNATQALARQTYRYKLVVQRLDDILIFRIRPEGGSK
ncbi:hypothetical protein GQ54DRAFT_311762 [Martensiomyces pterosporus]|nr:hypothetical protein GQ54DRAFT_311762 [Martensiomyces pterosporus]